MGDRLIRGVNLGGWLLLEKWITPSLFQGISAVDEFNYCKIADNKQLNELKKFRDSFIKEEDFKWLAEHKIKALRLPIGYWLFGDEPPFIGTIDYVDQAFMWAEKYGLKVLLDLHGLKGSQNGQMHSGKIGKTLWHKDENNIAQSLSTIRRVSRRYCNNTQLLGISLVNEPHPIIPKAVLVGFYNDAHAIIRDNCSKDTWVVISDGYLPSRWNKEMPIDKYPGVYIDTHHYQTHTPFDRILTPQMNLARVKFYLPLKIKRLQALHPVIVGEWSVVFDDKKMKVKTKEEQEQISKTYGREQLKAFESVSAWFYWTYKTEAGDNWSFRDCIEKQILSI